MIEFFPLQWPLGFPRHTGTKLNSRFTCTLGKARNGILREIKMLKGSNAIISTNIPVKKDGNLYASLKPISNDQGAAVYFTWKNEQKVLCCDAYDKIQDNLRAIEHSINAIRCLERWKCSDIINRTFTGFKALPEQKVETCWEVLKIEKTNDLEAIRKAYTTLAKSYHPDSLSGSHELFLSLKTAYEKAIQEVTK